MRFSKLFVLIAFSIFAVGCGRAPVLDVGEFAPYVARFEQSAAEQGAPVVVQDLIIRYGAMQNPQERAACELTEGETPTIVVRQDTWARLPEAEREELLFHEMGHCVLMRTHEPELKPEGIPASIMNPYMIRGAVYENNRSYYLRELFRPDLV